MTMMKYKFFALLARLKQFFKINLNISVSIFNFDKTKISYSEDIALIIQGPIFENTLPGIKFLRGQFPNAQIIISTWSNQKIDKNLLESLNIQLLMNNYPKASGILNSNFQLTAVKNSLNLLKENISFVSKIRTDYIPTKLLNGFDFVKKMDKILLNKNRLWSVDINTFANIPFSIGDILQIADIKTFKKFWGSSELIETDVSHEAFNKASSDDLINKTYELNPPEVMFAKNYLKYLGIDVNKNPTIAYQNSLKNNFGIIDADHIGLTFDKYSVLRAGRPNISEETYIDFIDWFNIQEFRQE